MRFVVRVDDVGQLEDQSRPDRGMMLFERWYACWKGLPICCAVVPAACDDLMLKWIRVECRWIGIHGWDHSNCALSPAHVVLGHRALPESDTLVPPYNKYDANTVEAARLCGLRVLLGGFDGENHKYGEAPKDLGGLTHYSAVRHLYAKSGELVRKLKDLKYSEHPYQVVLHHRWDVGDLDGVKKLRDALATSMVRA